MEKLASEGAECALTWMAKPANRMSLACDELSDEVRLALYVAASATPIKAAPTTWMMVVTTSEMTIAATRMRGSNRSRVDPWWSRRRRAVPSAR
jgi:hypothetical protein